uniref:Insulin-like domain-containing protein n=1 Tax=Ditylenchus dipsaci TaxID=166011 RepID=A0A915EDD9_9BILA
MVTCAMLSTLTCVDFNKKTRMCGRKLLAHIQNICEHTQCSESSAEDDTPEGSSTTTDDSKKKNRALPYECCTRGCSILNIQHGCCGNRSIVKTDTTVDLENVGTNYHEYNMNPSMEEEVNRQQREMEAITKSQQVGRHRRRHHHPHNTRAATRNIYRDLYLTPVTNEKLKEIRRKLHQQKSLDELELEF